MRACMAFCLLLAAMLAFNVPETRAQAAGGNPVIKLTTNKGDIVLELDAEKAPITTENFVQYVRDGFYNGTIFHRVIDNFMIQGGGLDADMEEKETRDAIENEARNGLKNDKYTIAMARTSDPHSASSQFFINVRDNDFLNHTAPNTSGWGYAVFGKVVDGFAVVDAIAKEKTGNRGMYGDVPLDLVQIIKAELVDQ